MVFSIRLIYYLLIKPKLRTSSDIQNFQHIYLLTTARGGRQRTEAHRWEEHRRWCNRAERSCKSFV